MGTLYTYGKSQVCGSSVHPHIHGYRTGYGFSASIVLVFVEEAYNVITSAIIGGHIMENDKCNLFFLIFGESGLKIKKVNHIAAFKQQI